MGCVLCLLVVCCVLCDVCCLLYVVRCRLLLFVVYRSSCIVRCLSSVVCILVFKAWCLL